MPQTDDRARLAAANNADIYELVFRALGLPYRRDSSMFVSNATPPSYYGNMTTLDPDDAPRQLAEIRNLETARNGSFALKDGFCRLDLHGQGFQVLFEAAWLWAPADRFTSPPPAEWERVRTAEALAAWEAAWSVTSPISQRLFPESLLSEPDIAFFGRRTGDGYDAGCIANLSAACVGLSNLFVAEERRAPCLAAARLATEFGQGRPVVGYDRGDALQAMLECGFAATGRLRVWVIGTP
jgi:hypothetical protein